MDVARQLIFTYYVNTGKCSLIYVPVTIMQRYNLIVFIWDRNGAARNDKSGKSGFVCEIVTKHQYLNK